MLEMQLIIQYNYNMSAILSDQTLSALAVLHYMYKMCNYYMHNFHGNPKKA